jgi:hypothetical protein
LYFFDGGGGVVFLGGIFVFFGEKKSGGIFVFSGLVFNMIPKEMSQMPVKKERIVAWRI